MSPKPQVLEVLGAAALTNTVLIFALAWAVGVRGFAASARDEAHAERCGAEVWLSAFNVSQGRVLRGDVPFRAIASGGRATEASLTL